MAELDINISIKGKPKPAVRKDEQVDEIWPTKLFDDDPFIPTTFFDFYDGWTVPLDLDIVSVDGENVIVVGEYSTKFRLGDLVVVSYLNDEGDERAVEGFLGEEASYASGQTTIFTGLTFPDTAFSIRTWIDCPDLSGPLAQVFSDTKTFDEANFISRPVNSTITCYTQETSVVPKTTIEREYGVANPDRWERKPLGAVSFGSENGDHVWGLGEGGFFNLRLELKKELSDDNAKKGDATSIAAGEEDFKEKASNEYARYIAKKRLSGRFAIAVTEDGSGSKGHYWSTVWNQWPEGSEDVCGYPVYQDWRPANAEDRLVFNKDRDDESYGIFFIPFDTSDVTNYKMTSGPAFASEEVDGYFIKPGKKYDIIKFPRRWGYYCRTQRVEKATGVKEYSGTGDWYNGCALEMYAWAGGDQARSAFGVIDPNDPSQSYHMSMWEIDIGPWHTQYFWGIYRYNSEDITFDWTASFSTVDYNHRVGLWWDRWPHRLKLKTGGGALWVLVYPQDTPPHNAAYFLTGNAENDETLEGVQAYDETALSGHTTIDLMSSPISAGDQSGLPVTYGWAESDGQGGSTFHRGRCSASQQSCRGDLKMGAGDSGSPYYPLREIWEKIAGIVADPTDVNGPQTTPMAEDTIWLPTVGSSEFWTQYGPGTYLDMPYSMFDNIPYGCSASSCKAEELVGIVKEQGSDEAVFIWRRTEETVDLEVTSKLNEYKGHIASFESSSPEHPLYTNLQTVIPNILGENTDCSQNIGDFGIPFGSRSLPFVDQFGGDNLRKKTLMGRAMANARTGIVDYEPCKESWNRPYIGSGQFGELICNVSLDVPIIVMFCKERAIRWSKYPGAIWDQFSALNEPYEELTESRIGQIAQYPNTNWRNEEQDFISLGL